MEKPIRWALCTVEPLETFLGTGQDNTICLLGDAVSFRTWGHYSKFLGLTDMQAHAMSTLQGAGAVSAMEDGFLLSFLLSQALASVSSPSLRKDILDKRVPAALRVYDQIRRPIVTDIRTRARETGFTLTLQDSEMIAAMATGGDKEVIKEHIERKCKELGSWGECTLSFYRYDPD